MKQVKPKFLIPVALLGGGIGAALMKILYATGVDHKGLLVRSHPAFAGIWILTALMAAALLLGCRKPGNTPGWAHSFSRSPVSGLCCLPLGAAFALSGFRGIFSAGQGLDVAVMALSLLSVPCLVYVAVCRFRGTTPHYLAFGVLCVFFGIRLVAHYRLWSSDPQLMGYVFYLLAQVCLMLASYRLAHCAAGGDSRKLSFPVLMGCFLSLMCLPSCPEPLFMGSCALWLLGCLPREEE